MYQTEQMIIILGTQMMKYKDILMRISILSIRLALQKKVMLHSWKQCFLFQEQQRADIFLWMEILQVKIL